MKVPDRHSCYALDRARLARLKERDNVRASVWIALHLGTLMCTGYLFVLCVGREWWVSAAAALVLHGTFFSFLGFAGASHEFAHGTVFTSKVVNRFFLRFFAFLVWVNSSYFRYTHAIHHRKTLDADHDIEVPTTRCLACSFATIVASILDLRKLFRTIRIQWLNANYIIPGRAGEVVLPPDDLTGRFEVAKEARFILFGHFLLISIFLMLGLWEFVFLVNLAGFIGNCLPNLLASVQHCGMNSGSPDFRENTRTVLLHPAIAFFYWNMNYHVEHHMFPGVPFYHLPELRKLISNDLPPATVGLLGVIDVIRSNHATRRFG